eukprot:gb/GEZN01000688.1/.p1 GENE.gb/GEZN01000688.1/~~gb/GEZN01000688.1/.p1  ORF type:complete len:1085 (-),score=70.15 gb/GEZN01000688.1/:356-3610(-)
MRVLITGSSGLVGQSLVASLCQHFSVIGLQRSVNQTEFNGSPEFIYRDICERAIVPQGVDVVVHCARIHGSASEMQRINVHGTENLLAQCIVSKVKKFIFFSSTVVYSASAHIGQAHIAEDTLPITRSWTTDRYTAEKIVLEQHVQKQCFQNGIDCIVLRLSCAGGRSPSGRQSAIFRTLSRLQSYHIHLPWQNIDVIDIKDICKLVEKMLLARQEVWNQTYNLTGRSFCIAKLYKPHKFSLPLYLPACFQRLLPSSASTVVQQLSFSNKKLLKALDCDLYWTPRISAQLPISDGLGFQKVLLALIGMMFWFFVSVTGSVAIVLYGWIFKCRKRRLRECHRNQKTPGILVSVYSGGHGHLLQAGAVISALKKEHPTIAVRAIFIETGGSCFLKQRLANLCPTALQDHDIFQLHDITDDRFGIAGFVAIFFKVFSISFFRNVRKFHRVLDRENITLWLNFMSPSAHVANMLISHPHVKMIVFSSQFLHEDLSLLPASQRTMDAGVHQMLHRYAFFAAPFSGRSFQFMAFSPYPQPNCLPQPVDYSILARNRRDGPLVCYGLYPSYLTSIFQLDRAVIVFVKDTKKWKEAFKKNPHIQVKATSAEFNQDFQVAAGVICLPSRATPSLCLAMGKPCYLLPPPGFQYEQQINLVEFTSRYPDLFCSMKTHGVKLLDWAHAIKQEDPIQSSKQVMQAATWLQQSSFDLLCQTFLAPYICGVLEEKKLGLEGLENVAQPTTSNSQTKLEELGLLEISEFFSPKEVTDLRSHLQGQLSHNLLTPVSLPLYEDPPFLQKLSLHVGVSLRAVMASDSSRAWVLRYGRTAAGRSNEPLSAEAPHFDIHRYSGPQFRVLIPLSLHGCEELCYLNNNSKQWERLQYCMGNLYVVKAGCLLHFAPVSGRRKTMLVMDYVERSDLPRFLPQKITSLYQNMKANQYMGISAIVPKRQDISVELTADVSPFAKFLCPTLFHRLTALPRILHPMVFHQSRKAIALALKHVLDPQNQSKHKMHLVSSFLPGLTLLELHLTAKELQAKWKEIYPEKEQLDVQVIYPRCPLKWETKQFIMCLTQLRPYYKQIGYLVASSKQVFG